MAISSSPRRMMWRATLSAASKDFFRRKVPSPSSTARPARAEFAGEGEGCGVGGRADGSDVDVEPGCVLFGRLRLEREDEAVLADGETDAGGFGAAEHLGEAVVAASAEEGVLGAEAGAGLLGGRDRELEGGAGVVVKAADEGGLTA